MIALRTNVKRIHFTVRIMKDPVIFKIKMKSAVKIFPKDRKEEFGDGCNSSSLL